MTTASAERTAILVVDDAPATLELIERHLSAAGYRVYTAPGVAEAIQFLEGEGVDLVITDLKMPHASGMDLVRHIRETYVNMEVMMITGYPSIEGAVAAVKTGADDYLAKPFTEEELLTAVQGTIDKLRLRRASRPRQARHQAARYGLIGNSAAIQGLLRIIEKAAAAHSATVLVTGDSGTGKELVARAIHYGSVRAAAPFVTVNCGGIPEGLLESELFGHVKGAFTGATETRAGFFLTADGGTIFLDEVSETSLAMQVKLLRVLQTKEVCMVGSTRQQKVNVRIIAATNKDLQLLVRKGLFREDLFFRLNVIAVEVPALRERGTDILELAMAFLERFALDMGRPTPRFAPEVLEHFLSYPWPGNVRELENIVQRLVVMTEGDEIRLPDLPAYMRMANGRPATLQRTLADVETEHIRNVLRSVDNNKTRAAEILGIDRKTLREKLKKSGVDDPA